MNPTVMCQPNADHHPSGLLGASSPKHDHESLHSHCHVSAQCWPRWPLSLYQPNAEHHPSGLLGAHSKVLQSWPSHMHPVEMSTWCVTPSQPVHRGTSRPKFCKAGQGYSSVEMSTLCVTPSQPVHRGTSRPKFCKAGRTLNVIYLQQGGTSRPLQMCYC
jgi:hypothetical protein